MLATVMLHKLDLLISRQITARFVMVRNNEPSRNAVENNIIPEESDVQIMLSQAGFNDIKIDDGSESYLASARKSISWLSS